MRVSLYVPEIILGAVILLVLLGGGLVIHELATTTDVYYCPEGYTMESFIGTCGYGVSCDRLKCVGQGKEFIAGTHRVKE